MPFHHFPFQMLSTYHKQHVVYWIIINCVNIQDFFFYEHHLHVCYFALCLEFESSVVSGVALTEGYIQISLCVYICIGYNSEINSG